MMVSRVDQEVIGPESADCRMARMPMTIREDNALAGGDRGDRRRSVDHRVFVERAVRRGGDECRSKAQSLRCCSMFPCAPS